MSNTEKLDQYLAARGLRHSTERTLMLKHIETLKEHFTIESLIETFGKVQHVSQASIYRNIKIMVEAGIVTEHRFPMREVEYELSSKAATHCHRVCTVCGEVKEFRDATVVTTLHQHRFRAFSMESSSIYVYGICKKCMNKKQH